MTIKHYIVSIAAVLLSINCCFAEDNGTCMDATGQWKTTPECKQLKVAPADPLEIKRPQSYNINTGLLDQIGGGSGGLGGNGKIAGPMDAGSIFLLNDPAVIEHFKRPTADSDRYWIVFKDVPQLISTMYYSATAPTPNQLIARFRHGGFYTPKSWAIFEEHLKLFLNTRHAYIESQATLNALSVSPSAFSPNLNFSEEYSNLAIISMDYLKSALAVQLQSYAVPVTYAQRQYAILLRLFYENIFRLNGINVDCGSGNGRASIAGTEVEVLSFEPTKIESVIGDIRWLYQGRTLSMTHTAKNSSLTFYFNNGGVRIIEAKGQISASENLINKTDSFSKDTLYVYMSALLSQYTQQFAAETHFAVSDTDVPTKTFVPLAGFLNKYASDPQLLATDLKQFAARPVQ